MVFVYHRRVSFGETDAAGVMYFANALAICHEAYEDALRHFGVDLPNFFQHSPLALPIVHASIDYRRPSYCGDLQQVHLRPTQTSEATFEVEYVIYGEADEKLSQAQTRHTCISKGDRKRSALSAELLDWIATYNVDEIQTFQT